MFIILPAKIIYEFIFAMVREDDNASDVNKKLGGAIMGVMLAVSLSIVVPLANNLSINVSKALLVNSTALEAVQMEILGMITAVHL